MAVHDGPPVVVQVMGRVEMTTATQFHDGWTSSAGAASLLTVDLTEVHLLTSAGVRVLFDLRDHLATHGHQLVLLAADNGPVHQILDLVGLPCRVDGR